DVEVADEPLLALRGAEAEAADQQAVPIGKAQAVAALLDLPAEDFAVERRRLAQVSCGDVQVGEPAVACEGIVGHGPKLSRTEKVRHEAGFDPTSCGLPSSSAVPARRCRRRRAASGRGSP